MFTTKFIDSSILITIISWDYLNEYISDVTIPTQVIQYNQHFLQADQPIILQYSNQIKLYHVKSVFWYGFFPIFLIQVSCVCHICKPTSGSRWLFFRIYSWSVLSIM
jgi:hypothetical protein